MTNSLILHARDSAGDGKPLPLVLAGHPSEVGGLKAHYRRKRVISDGGWVHQGSGDEFTIDQSRTNEWLENYAKRLAAGHKTPILKRHTEDPSADDTLGYVVGLSRDGQDFYADCQFLGDDALSCATRNDVSIYEKAQGRDAKGNPHGRFLHHIAATPTPNQPDLGPFVTIAASAGGSAVDVPIYEPATASTQELPMLKPETQTALRTKLGLKPEATEQEIVDAAANAALNPPADKTAEVTALSASVTTLTTERDNAIAERDSAKNEVLALSANAPKTDPLVLSMFGETFEAKAESAMESGVPKAAVDYFAGLCRNTDGTPAALALSACTVPAGEGKTKATRLGIAVMDGLTKLAKGGFGTGVATGQVAPGNLLCLSSADPTAQTPEQLKAAVDANLAQTDLGRRALAARKAS